MPAKGTSKYTREQITEALTLVVAHQGNVIAAANEAGVPRETLRQWVEETHRDEFVEIDQRHNDEVEQRVKRRAIAVADRAAAVELDLLNKLADVQPRELPAALQAVAAVKDKNIGKYLALTGRPSDGQQQGPGQLVENLHHLAKRGLLKLNVEIGPAPPEPTLELPKGEPSVEG